MEHYTIQTSEIAFSGDEDDDLFWDQCLLRFARQFKLRILPFALATACALGQGLAPPLAALPPGSGAFRSLSITITQQTGMAKDLAGLALNGYSITMCSADGQPVNVGGGAGWQLAERGGLQLLNLHVAAAAATRVRAKSGWELAATGGAEILYDVATAGALNFVRVNPARLIGKVWRAAPIILSHKLMVFSAARDKIQPDLIARFGPDMLDPAVLYAIPPGFGVCLQKLLIASPGGPPSVVGVVFVN